MNATRAVAPVVLTVLATAVVGGTVGCGDGKPKAKGPTGAGRSATLLDVLPDDPAFFAHVRLHDVARDSVYGPLVRPLFARALADGAAPVSAVRALEALRDTDELYLAAETSSGRDSIFVLKGVRADIAPGALVDGEGHAVWTKRDDVPGVDEYVPIAPASARDVRAGDDDAALFELSARTWVLARGRSIDRVRDRVRDPGKPKTINLPDDPLLFVRIKGDALVREVPALSEASVRTLGDDLVWLGLEVGPGRGGELTMRLRYRSDGPRETAAETLREVVRASRRPAARTLVTALLADADVDEDAKAKQVVVRRQVPTAVLSRLALDAASLLAPGATAPPTGTDAGAPPERVDAGAYFPRKTPLLQLGPFDGGIRME